MPILICLSNKDKRAIPRLVKYVMSHDQKTEYSISLTHNIAPEQNNLDGLIRAFTENNGLKKKRKNGVVIFHDILSFHPEDTETLKNDPFILEDMARKYIEIRADKGVALAKLHHDKDHIHVHILVSPADISGASLRLSKAEFLQLKREMERFQFQNYPELKKSYVRPSLRKHIEQDIQKATLEIER